MTNTRRPKRKRVPRKRVPRKRVLHVTWEKRSGGHIKVRPVVAQWGDEVVWHADGRQPGNNRTGKPIHLFFVNEALFGTHVADVHPGRTKTLTIRVRPETPTIYRYAMYFEEWNIFGEGSSPIVIVNPPDCKVSIR